MKIHLLTTALLSVGGAQAFCPCSQPQSTLGFSSCALSAAGNNNNNNNNNEYENSRNMNWMGSFATAVAGLALSSQVAVAGMLPADMQHQSAMADVPSQLVAVENLDFSLPSYDKIGANTGGFGQGTEARLGLTDSMTNHGQNEKAKQEEAMRKAEAARLERKEAEKKARIQRNEDIAREAEDKRKRDAEKVAQLFSGS